MDKQEYDREVEGWQIVWSHDYSGLILRGDIRNVHRNWYSDNERISSTVIKSIDLDKKLVYTENNIYKLT